MLSSNEEGVERRESRKTLNTEEEGKGNGKDGWEEWERGHGMWVRARGVVEE